jgi:hypothetical protein
MADNYFLLMDPFYGMITDTYISTESEVPGSINH